MNLRLDYSQREGTFKLSKPSVPLSDQRGFMTLTELPQEQAENFVSLVLGNYPQLLAANGLPNPDYEAIHQELQTFLNEQATLQQQQQLHLQESRQHTYLHQRTGHN